VKLGASKSLFCLAISGGKHIQKLYYVDGNLYQPSQAYNTYHWVIQNGYDSFGDWVEEAAEIVGR